MNVIKKYILFAVCCDYVFLLWLNELFFFLIGQTSSSDQNLSVLDFERSVILHLPKMTPKQVRSSDLLPKTSYLLFQKPLENIHQYLGELYTSLKGMLV